MTADRAARVVLNEEGVAVRTIVQSLPKTSRQRETLMNATILDVIDNFTLGRDIPYERLSGRDLWGFGEAVREFTASYVPPAPRPDGHPVYLGGWPSANFWLAGHGQLIMSALLYTGEVLIKDPISDWFCTKQYQNETTLTDTPGYLAEAGKHNTGQTRAFLAMTIPAMLELRPLVEAGAVVLVPAQRTWSQHAAAVKDLRSAVHHIVSAEPRTLMNRFAPGDIAVDDRRRGTFVFSSEPPEPQVVQALDGAARYFAREYVLAQAHGFEYTAVFPFEQFLCRRTLQQLTNSAPGERVVQALLRSSLPIFQGLTPSVVAKVRDLDTFTEFRRDLHITYRDLPVGQSPTELAKFIAEAEGAMLAPQLERAQNETGRGALRRLGVKTVDIAMSMVAAVGVDVAQGTTGSGTLMQGGLQALVDQVRGSGRPRSRSVWTELTKHHRSVQDELVSVRVQPANPPTEQSWPPGGGDPGSITVTSGSLIWVPPINHARTGSGGYTEGPYAICQCGSGLKWRFCCAGLPGAAPPASSNIAGDAPNV